MGGSGATTKMDWFDRGVRAVSNSLRTESEDGDSLTDCYPCPICFTFYRREAVASGDLTFEHAPPRSLGGKRIALTCRECNGTAGRTVDAHAAIERRLVDGLNGRRPLDVDFRGVRGRVHLSTDTVHMVVDRQRNDPAKVDDLFATIAATEHNAEPLDLSWTARAQFDHRQVRLSYLRSAYLVAFARFGFRMVVGTGYVDLRRQVRFLTYPHLDVLPVLMKPEWPLGLHQLRHRTLGQSLVVGFGTWSVLLPFRADDVHWYERYKLEVRASTHEKTTSGAPILWPTEPMHEMDRQRFDLTKDRPVDLFRDLSDAA